MERFEVDSIGDVCAKGRSIRLRAGGIDDGVPFKVGMSFAQDSWSAWRGDEREGIREFGRLGQAQGEVGILRISEGTAESARGAGAVGLGDGNQHGETIGLLRLRRGSGCGVVVGRRDRARRGRGGEERGATKCDTEIRLFATHGADRCHAGGFGRRINAWMDEIEGESWTSDTRAAGDEGRGALSRGERTEGSAKQRRGEFWLTRLVRKLFNRRVVACVKAVKIEYCRANATEAKPKGEDIAMTQLSSSEADESHWSVARMVWGLVGAALVSFSSSAGAASPEPAGAPVATMQVVPARAVLLGPDAVQQLAAEVHTAAGVRRDVTRDASYASSDPRVVSVNSTGMVAAAGDGEATVTVRAGDVTAQVAVRVDRFSKPLPVHFANEVVPILTKLGCNAGGCHGKASGQNGFRLSLFGYEPGYDYEALVKEGRGRRVFPAAPEQSLLLTKGAAKVPHGGGRRLEGGSHEYRVLARWIGGGMPMGQASDPVVTRVEIYPDARIMPRGSRQQVVVTAHYSDGRTEDVTRWAQCQSNDPEVAGVDETGLVETRGLSGQAAIMARYQGLIAVFRATVPMGEPLAKAADFPANSPIDVAVLNQWKALGVLPSELCSDAEFIRRVSLDVIGTLPGAEEVKAFVADTSPDKRARLVDQLLERPEYASYFAIKWADVLRNKREGDPLHQRGTYRFYDWIRENLARNTPYDRFVRSILAANGTPESTPPVQWYRRIKATDAFVDDTAQVFLGMRLQCAKCHHHPFETWSQDDYYGFAAFFARVGRKPAQNARRMGGSDEAIFTARTGTVSHPKTGKVMEPKGLGGDLVAVAANVDPRQKLVDWMAEPKNPFFARALVNRYWAHFFGRGIVEPMDDLRLSNPPSNPELMDTLANEFVRSGYDLKQLVRSIATSRVYGLSSLPNEHNAKDKQSFARHYPKRMSAEVLLDAISQVTGVPTAFSGFPSGTRAIELPDESIASTFLDTFGRPKRDTPCECERVGAASLGQSLMLLNSNDVQGKLTAAGSRAEALAKDPRPDTAKVEDLFWAAFARLPSSGETASALAHLGAHPSKRREAYEDIVWALINAKEFQFND